MSQTKPHKVEELERERLANEQAIVDRQQLIADVIEQMSTPTGRRNTYRMLNHAGLIYGDAAVEENLLNTTVTLMTAACARRQVAWLFDHITRLHCNNLWLQMLEENEPNRISHKE